MAPFQSVFFPNPTIVRRDAPAVAALAPYCATVFLVPPEAVVLEPGSQGNGIQAAPLWSGGWSRAGRMRAPMVAPPIQPSAAALRWLGFLSSRRPHRHCRANELIANSQSLLTGRGQTEHLVERPVLVEPQAMLSSATQRHSNYAARPTTPFLLVLPSDEQLVRNFDLSTRRLRSNLYNLF